MLGRAFDHVETRYKIIQVGSSQWDLSSYSATLKMFKEVQQYACIHLAARVGGVKANTDYVADFCTDNLTINTNVLKAANHVGLTRVLSLLSTCIYPDAASYPLTEDQIHAGPPHHSNFGYAHAKRMLDVQSRAYRKQFGRDYITAVPNNLFGEHDNFDLNASHAVPAIIRKMYEAKIKNENVVLWGDGSPLREFTYSRDLANILMFLLDNYNDPSPINVGNTQEISIKEVAECVADILNFKGDIIWDNRKPMGQHRKPSDNSRLLSLGWEQQNYTDFKKALLNTCRWVTENYPKIRGF